MKPADLFEIALTMVPGIGPVTSKSLIAYCGDAESVFRESFFILSKVPGVGPVNAGRITSFKNFERAEAELRFIEDNQIRTRFFTNESYPYRLKQIPDSPIMIYLKGSIDLNAPRILGIIGTRRPTLFGKKVCRDLIRELADTGCVIISGLAYGIDILAHRAAIDHKICTGAVLAHGLDRIYPSEHHGTVKDLLSKGGGIITEYPMETNPDAPNFPKRNRIVAGLCDAILVIESAEQGGSLITADLAFQYNRDVMAIPGRPVDTASKGCNALIKSNRATLVEDASDVLSAMNWDLSKISAKNHQIVPPDLTKDEKFVLEKLGNGIFPIDRLANEVRLQPGQLSHVLLELELRDLIEVLPGKKYRRK